MILDCHTHRQAPAPEAIISTSPIGFVAQGEQMWSTGLHPWDLPLYCADNLRIKDEIWVELVAAAASPYVVAVGECGIDLINGGILATQMLAFRRQALLAERLRKPLIIHSVKAHDIITGMKKDLNPEMPWIIHGFRNRPTIAEIYLNAGCWLSFGEKFSPESLDITPADRLLAETDESDMPIERIIMRLEESAQKPLRDSIIANGQIFKTPSTDNTINKI
ncbi:MAG: TatD family hydrolase [Muribaculaceae bacterium]|nr:TatD family hydrolase [Muribaculaceae bacterium]